MHTTVPIYFSITKELARFFTKQTVIYFTLKYFAKMMSENETFFQSFFRWYPISTLVQVIGNKSWLVLVNKIG